MKRKKNDVSNKRQWERGSMNDRCDERSFEKSTPTASGLAHFRQSDLSAITGGGIGRDGTAGRDGGCRR